MLDKMHESAKSGIMKFMIFGLMGFAVFGLVLMDIGGFFRGGVQRTTVATIAGESLSVVSFDNTVRRVLNRQGLSPELAYQAGMIHRILQSEVNNNLLQHAAIDLGIRINDEIVARQVGNIVMPYTNSATSPAQALQQFVRSQGMSETGFVEMIRAEMTNGVLSDAITLGTSITSNKEALDLYKYQNESRTIDVLFLPNKDIRGLEDVQEDTLIAQYKESIEQFMTTETRNFTIAFISEDLLEQSLEISNEELQQLYDESLLTYTLPERRVLQQVIVDNANTANSIVERTVNGAGLQEAAKAETGEDSTYIGEDTFEEAGLLDALAEPVFSSEKNSVIGPVETSLGWHVLYVKDIIAEEIQPFEEVKEDLRKEILTDRLSEEIYAFANRVDDQLASGMSMAAVAENEGLKTDDIGPVKKDGATNDNKDGLKGYDEETRSLILDVAFDLLEEETSPVMELPDGRFAAIYIEKITERAPIDFDEVKENIKETWIKGQKETKNQKLTIELLEKINSGEKTLADLSKETGNQIKTHKISRNEDAKPPFDRTSKANIFIQPKDRPFMVKNDEGYMITIIKSVDLPKEENIPSDEIEKIKQFSQKNVNNEFLQLYLDQLKTEYNVKINNDLLAETYGPGNQVYN